MNIILCEPIPGTV